MRSARRVAAVIMVLVMGALALGGAPAPSASADETPTECEITANTTIRTAVDWDCPEIVVTATVTIGNGGELTVDGRTLLLSSADDGTASLIVGSGGNLTFTGGAIVGEGPDGEPGGQIVLAPGSEAAVTDATVSNLALFRVQSSDVLLDGVGVVTGAGDGIRVEDASPTLKDVTVEGGVAGIRVSGPQAAPRLDGVDIVAGAGDGIRIEDASPTLRDVKVDGGVAGVRVSGPQAAPEIVHIAFTGGPVNAIRVVDGATVHADEATLEAADAVVRLEGPSKAFLTKGSVPTTGTDAKLVTTAAGAPNLTMVGVEGADLGSIDVDSGPGSLVEISWLVDVTVAPEDATKDATVRFIAHNGEVVAEASVPMDSEGEVVVVPDRRFVASVAEEGPQDTSYNPYTVVATHGKFVAVDEPPVPLSGPLHLILPNCQDAEPPTWPSPAPFQQVVAEDGVEGFSPNGTVVLEWEDATDTAGLSCASPGGVDFYEIIRRNGDMEPDRRVTRGLTYEFEDLPEGAHRFIARPVDYAGNAASQFSQEVEVVVDATPPAIVIAANRTAGPVPLHFNDTVEIELTATDDADEVASLSYSIDEGDFIEFDENITFADERTYNLTVMAKDEAGGVTKRFFDIVVDRQDPTLSVSLKPGLPNGQNLWYTSPPELSVLAEDQGPSGVAVYRYRLDPSAPWTVFDKKTNLTAPGEHVVEVQVLDGAGNSRRSNHLVRIDVAAPSVSLNLTGTQGEGVWYTSPVALTAQVTEAGSGVAALRYRVGDGVWGEFQNPLMLDFSGTQRITVAAVDEAGGVSTTTSRVVSIDQEPPVPPVAAWKAHPDGQIEASWQGRGPVDLVSGVRTVAVEQGAGGVAQRSFGASSDASDVRFGPFQTGTYELRVRVVDAAGNAAATPWATVAVTESAGGLASVADGQVARGTVALSYTALADFDAVEVLFYIDGELRTALSQPPYEYAWDTTMEDDGVYEVRVVAKDATGRTFEETTTYEVRNAYAHVMQDVWLPVSAAAGAALVSVVLAVVGAIQWRRWEIA